MGSVSRVLSAAAVLAVLACSGGAKDEEYGGANVAVSANALTGQGVPSVVYVRVYGTTTRGAAFDQTVQAYQEAGNWEIRLNRIPIGTYRVHGWAFLDQLAIPGVDPADWESALPDPSVTIAAKQTTTIGLLLQQTAPPVTVTNAAPTINSIVASQYMVDSTSGAEDVISLVATASDANGDSLSYLWVSSAGGTFSSDAALATTWTPAGGYSGPVTLTLTVTDFPYGAASAVSLRFDVSPANARGQLVVSPIEINNWPDILSMTADNAQIEPGGSALVVVDVADADDNAVAFAWTDACDAVLPGAVSSFTPVSGSVTGTAAGAVLSTVYTPPAGASVCTLSVAVDDGRGGTNTGVFTVNVRARPVGYAPDFTTAIMSPTGLPPTPILAGGNVNFTVAAVETLADLTTITTASFTWLATVNGAAVPPAQFTDLSGNGSRVVFAVPACAAPGTFTYAVRGTAIGSAPFGVPNDSFMDFGFTVTCP